MRQEFSAKIKMQAALRAAGRCEECSAKLFTGNIEYDHLIPCEMGGDASLANCSVKCRSCHKLKTTADDVPAIAKAKRRERRDKGIRKSVGRPLPGTRASGIRKRMSGAVERW